MILPTGPFRRGKTISHRRAQVLLVVGAVLTIGVMLLVFWYFGGGQ